MWQQFGLIGIGLALVGARASFRSERKIFAILLAVAAAMGFIALYLRGISTVYYFSLTYLALAVWIGFGIKTFLESAERLRVNSRARLAWLTTTQTMRAIFLCVPLATLATNFSNLDQSNFFSAREYARAALNDQLAPNAVVIAPWEISQPMRYLQFVENVRPDVLVVNVSPVMKQFETMRANAYELKRPFYLAQFVPENQNALTLRAVQAIPLPMRAIPQPHYVVNKKIVNEIEIIGYDLEPDPPLPGQSARVLIYYRALARVYPIYSAIFSVNDITGHPWGNQDSFPGSFYFPTYRWQVGNVFRDAFPLNLPPDAPSGLYALDLSWYVYDLDTNKRDESREFATALGTIRVGDIPSTALIAQKTNAQSENGIALVGWNAAPALNSNFISVARGETIQLDLFWRAARGQQNNFTVFVHLLDSAGRVVSDADSPPSRGVYPTDRWNSGEIFRDRHALIIPRELAPGDYSIEVGMYLPATNQRVLFDRGDKILLGTVRVR
ncbi:MAG: hypothetical protein HY070_13920 [Chloroflexi bacterium]|nr:hypothetical protein [Chloroflexota bacterium]